MFFSCVFPFQHIKNIFNIFNILSPSVIEISSLWEPNYMLFLFVLIHSVFFDVYDFYFYLLCLGTRFDRKFWGLGRRLISPERISICYFQNPGDANTLEIQEANPY